MSSTGKFKSTWSAVADWVTGRAKARTLAAEAEAHELWYQQVRNKYEAQCAREKQEGRERLRWVETSRGNLLVDRNDWIIAMIYPAPFHGFTIYSNDIRLMSRDSYLTVDAAKEAVKRMWLAPDMRRYGIVVPGRRGTCNDHPTRPSRQDHRRIRAVGSAVA